MVVLDSDILIGLLRDNNEAISFMEKIENRGEKLCTTVINAHELFEGALLHSRPEEIISKIEFFLRSFEYLSFTPAVSWISSKISAELRKKGMIIDFQDIAIASIAISNDEKIVTRNIKDFSRIKELKIEKW